MPALTAPTTGNTRTRSQRLNRAGIVTLAIASCAALVLSVVVHRHGAPPRTTFSFELRVVDERGQAIAGAVFAAAGKHWQTDASGEARIAADGVLAGSLHAQGYLDEPVVVGSESRRRRVTVRLWATLGGRRFSYHAAGDVMLARRYLDRRPGAATARLDADRLRESARAIVSQVAPIFRAATLSSVNLETVVGDLPRSAAYPGKDLVIQTPPQALAGLEELSVDAALGANNHVRDYGDEGIASTRLAVEARGIAYGGAGLDASAAARPLRIGRGPAGLVLLAFSGLSGDGVNDAYTAEPGPTSPAWLRERRPWAYRAGGRALVPLRERTIGEAWKAFRRLEHENARAASRAWHSLAAVYPQLQDWVARRGHGGAAPWDPERSTAAIQTAARENRPVVVQLQDGIQYAPAPPSRLIETARAAIDAGADIVIAHHPHVLQGFEWYRGKLIAFSLGNFVFDQDLLVTYPGGFLRTIWEGDRLLEARFVPTILAGYRPLPVAGPTAMRMLRRLMADSVLPARSSRHASDRTRLLPRRLAPASIVRGRLEHNTLLLLRGEPRPVGQTVVLDPQEVERLSPTRLYAWGDGAAGPGLVAGRDLFGYGSFDDAAGSTDGVLHWSFGRATTREVEDGNGYLVIRRSSGSNQPALARPASRIPIREPFLGDERAAYELRFRARRQGSARPAIRFDFYRFDAGGLSIATSSEIVGRTTVRLSVPSDRRWHELAVPIDRPRGADYVLPYFVLDPTGSASALSIDDVALIEWRRASGPRRPQALEYLENATGAPVRVSLAAYPMAASSTRSEELRAR